MAGRVARMLIAVAVIAALAWIVAGRADHPWVNAYLAVLGLVGIAVLVLIDPAVMRARLERRQRGEDPARLLAIRVMVLLTNLVGLLDVGRLHLSDGVPAPVRVVALLLVALSFGWTLLAMRTNPFFVPVIRIQPERGHRTISRGPYAVVRHPGYLGMAAGIPATALALGSWLALVPGLACAALFVRRAIHEDRFLRQRLEGYPDYAARVRHLLIPAVW